jgi:hypothetical protein
VTESAGEATDGITDDHHLGRLAKVAVRDVWTHESTDFTPWLAGNLDLLGEALAIDGLELEQREVPVGPFYLDLQARDSDGRTVIIENQLESSDHVHLGQLLVYAAGRRADVIVWVATRFRDEYRAALDWLNEHTGPETAFFGVEIGVVRIGSSAPAPVLDVIVQPNGWGKAQKIQTQATQGASPLALARQDFFRRVFDQIAERLPAFRVPRASAENWAPFKSGPFGSYSVVFSQSALRVEVYLDSSSSPDLPKALFDELYADRAEIEQQFGAPLRWDRIDDRRASRIAVYRNEPVRLADETDTAAAVSWAANQAVRLMQVLDHRMRSRAVALRARTGSPDPSPD